MCPLEVFRDKPAGRAGEAEYAVTTPETLGDNSAMA
jgi:hypothetical protein